MSIRLLSRDVAFYGLLNFLQRSLGIILVPIYTRVLTRSNYGNLDVMLAVWGVMTVLADLQFVAGFSRMYLEQRHAGRGPRFVGTAILTRATVATALLAVILSLGFGGLLELSFIPSFLANRTAWTILLLSVPVALTYDILLAQVQLLRWKKWFFAGAFGNTLVSTILCVVFTVFLRWGIVGVALGQGLGTLTATCILLAGVRGEMSFRYQSRLLREIARYSLPMVPGWWLTYSSAYISRFFIYAGRGASENAILAITTKLAAVVGLFCLAFRTAWQPLAMAYIGDENAETFYIRSLRVFTAGGLFSVCVLIVLSKPALAILAPQSYGVVDYYVPFFLVALIIGELDVNLQLGNQISKKTHWMSVASALAFTINLLVLIALTSRIGIYAAGLGLLLSFIVKVLITYFSGQRNYRIRYDKRSLIVFGLGCATLLMLSLGRSGKLINDTIFYSSTMLIGIGLPWLTLAASERQLIRDRSLGFIARLFNTSSAQ